MKPNKETLVKYWDILEAIKEGRTILMRLRIDSDSPDWYEWGGNIFHDDYEYWALPLGSQPSFMWVDAGEHGQYRKFVFDPNAPVGYIAGNLVIGNDTPIPTFISLDAIGKVLTPGKEVYVLCPTNGAYYDIKHGIYLHSANGYCHIKHRTYVTKYIKMRIYSDIADAVKASYSLSQKED